MKLLRRALEVVASQSSPQLPRATSPPLRLQPVPMSSPALPRAQRLRPPRTPRHKRRPSRIQGTALFAFSLCPFESFYCRDIYTVATTDVSAVNVSNGTQATPTTAVTTEEEEDEGVAPTYPPGEIEPSISISIFFIMLLLSQSPPPPPIPPLPWVS